MRSSPEKAIVTADEYVATAGHVPDIVFFDLSGTVNSGFKVHINEDNELIISLEKKSEEKEEDKKRKGTYLRREFSYTQFQQSLLLPDNIEREKISARVENGVMTIDIPKKKVEELAAATRQIEVK